MRLREYQKSDSVKVEGSQKPAAERALAWLRTLPDSELQDALYQASPAARQRGKLLLGSSVSELPNMQELAISALCLRVLEIKCAVRLMKPPAPATIRKRPDPSAMQAEDEGLNSLILQHEAFPSANAEDGPHQGLFIQAGCYDEEEQFDQ